MGDADGLLDCLIQACQQKPAVSTSHSGYGRELVPYFDSDFVEDLHVSNRRRSRASPPTRVGASYSAKRTTKNIPSGGRRVMDEAVQNFADELPALPSGMGSPMYQAGGSVDVGKLLGPGFFVSPKPEAVPLPTFGLLSRASSPKQTHVEEGFGRTHVSLHAIEV